MPPSIQTIHLRSYSVNCYLLENSDQFYLIDTGAPKSRSDLDRALENRGCKPGNLKLIILTHADLDHSGNAAYLRQKYATKVALHRGEAPVVEQGSMSLSRGSRNLLARFILPLLTLPKSDRFEPDILVFEPINRSTAFDKSAAEGHPTLELLPNTPGVQNYYQLADAILYAKEA